MANPKFKSWMQEVDICLTEKCGLNSECLGDFCYYDAFEDERSPAEVADDVLEQNDFPVMEKNELYR